MLRGERRRDRRQLLVQAVSSLPSAEDTVIEREAGAQLRRVLARLPRRSAAVLVMRHGGMSYREIAEALGVKVGHVGTCSEGRSSRFEKRRRRNLRLGPADGFLLSEW